jgi:hypothetical protein
LVLYVEASTDDMHPDFDTDAAFANGALIGVTKVGNEL